MLGIIAGDMTHKAIVTFENCRKRFTAIYPKQFMVCASDWTAVLCDWSESDGEDRSTEDAPK